jgi:predicted amidohydrolase YtcJ
MVSMVLRHARVVGLGTAAPDAPCDILVEDGRVTAVHPGIERPAGLDEVEAGGRWLVPGLWDQHVHLGQWVVTAQRVDFSATTSPDDVVRQVAAHLARHPGRPLVGHGHRSGSWQREATVSELDAVSGDVPVVLVSGDVHHGWLNTAALRRLGVADRDSVLIEQDWFTVYPQVSELFGSGDASAEGYRQSLLAAAARGVVGVADFELEDGTEAWSRRWHEGCDLLRVRTATYPDALDNVVARGLRTGDALPGCDDRATVGPLKIISDGSLNTHTAWCCAPYAHAADADLPSGAPNVSADELVDLMRRAHTAGLQVATHAIGDAAVREAVRSYAATGARGSIEHVQLALLEDIGRMAGLGIRASVQPSHLLDDRDIIDQLWPGRTDRCFAFRSMLDRGVDLVLGSDAPVSPLDPWQSIAAAVHRAAPGQPAWHPEQALTAGQALAASVDGQPTVQPGSRGDLVLLDADPLAAGTDLRAMPVAATFVAGVPVFSTL